MNEEIIREVQGAEKKRCPKCGAELDKSSKFCVFCGEDVSERKLNFENISFEDIEENRILSVLCYMNIFMIIPLVAKPDSKFIKFHANQGIIFIFAWLLMTFIFIIPILGWIIGAFGYLFLMVVFIIGVINAYKGKVKRLPLIGKYDILK